VYRLEVQKIDDQHLRINFQEDDAHSAFKEYQPVDFSTFEPYFNVLLEQIPQEYLQNGSSIVLFEKLKDKSHALFQVLFSTIGDRIKKSSDTKNPPNLQIVIDEEIAYIPFEILYTGEHFLWEGFIINRQIVTSSINHTHISKQSTKTLSITLVGNPSGDNKIDASVRDELLNLYEILQNYCEVRGPHLGKEVNQYRLTELLSTTDVFHFSGHFRINKNGNTGWELAENQFFTTDHIYKLKKIPRFIFGNTCGEKNGISSNGFIRKFLNRGVQTYLTTTGKVPTDEAGYFGKEFYKEIIMGKTVGEAVFQSKKKLIKRFGFSNLAWMFYVLYGDGNLTLFSRFKSKQRIKWKNIFFSLILAVGLVSVFNITNSFFHKEMIEIVTHPPNAKIIIDDETVAYSPHKISLRNYQNVTLVKSGFDTIQCHLEEVDEKWGLVLDESYNGIVNETNVSRVQTLYPSHEPIVLIPEDYHIITFVNINNSIQIQGSSIVFNGNTINFWVDSHPHRYLFMYNGLPYNNKFSVKSDTTITKSDILDSWKKRL